ncbi:MAG: hypothetical protein J2P28_11665, partial [Actinobacteria bacterium]|nr:hypothetical protein [Actinomycetota bacterium]
MLRWCVKEAIQRPDTDLDYAAALCESMLYDAVVGLDLKLMDRVSKGAAALLTGPRGGERAV